MRRNAWMAGVLVTSTALGCVGQIGDPPTGGVDPGTAGPDPGRVTVHRLNRTEYNNTVRDLLGTALRPADDFPADDLSYGFDNIADVLSMSPTHVELYERAAELLVSEAMSLPASLVKTKLEGETVGGSVGVAAGEAWNLYSSGDVSSSVSFPGKGQYRISTRVWGTQAGDEPAKVVLSVGGVQLGTYDVPNTSTNPVVLEAMATVDGGNKVVSVEFTNDFYDETTMADRNLYVDWIEVEGPLDAQGVNPQRERIFTCDPVKGGDTCARQILGDFARKAWRRAISDDELNGLFAFVTLAKAEGDSVDVGLKLALQAVLVSPNFLFRIEMDPDPTSLTPHPLNDFELASRLSYFLWSSMPDDELLQVAEEGRLQDEGELRAQVLRMLDDPRSESLIENFAGQWLYTRALGDHEPDYAIFPTYNDELQEAMRTETKLFFREFLYGDRSLTEMLTADFTFANDKLAAYYGLPAVEGSEFKQVSLEGTARQGLLTQGSLLTVTSHPTRTSPVKRGKWVLEQLLCSAPPPPPPGVEGLPKVPMPTSTLREKMEQHRKDPVCASCHTAMDPIGFALESFDGIGTYRTEDQGFPIDASGQLPTGETFNGAREMADLISGDPRFGRCASKQLFTYALGRGSEPRDRKYIDHIAVEFAAGGYKMKDLIALIVTSEPFRLRRGETVKAGSEK